MRQRPIPRGARHRTPNRGNLMETLKSLAGRQIPLAEVKDACVAC
jgi:hypothetical protein